MKVRIGFVSNSSDSSFIVSEPVTCSECDEVICVCGYEYEDWSAKKLSRQVKMLERLLKKRMKIEVKKKKIK